MKYAVLAWVQFIVGLVLLGTLDYYVRWRDGWLGSPGLATPDQVWFGVPMLLGAVAVLLLWRSTANVQRLWLRFAIVALQSSVGFIVYIAACLWYVLETGVDSI